MNTSLANKYRLLICALVALNIGALRAGEVDSYYTGPNPGFWNDPANWNPATVPNNNGDQQFNVFNGSAVTLDVDAAVNSLTFTDDYTYVDAYDHNFSSLATSFGSTYGSSFGVNVPTRSVVANLGNLAEFSGGILSTNGGGLTVDASYFTPGITGTLQFNGADIHATDTYIGLYGPGASITDENGNSAIRNLEHVLPNGFIDLENGVSFASKGSVTNDGDIWLQPYYAGNEGPDTFVINGDYTASTDGRLNAVVGGAAYDGRFVITGAMTNYDSNRKTLAPCGFLLWADGGRSATVQVLGGKKALDIVTSNAVVDLFGPDSGLRDKAGNDALRNLAVSRWLRIGDRSFTTVGSLRSSERLTAYGNGRLNVNGSLTITGGQLQVFPFTAAGIFGASPETSSTPHVLYGKSYVRVTADLNLMRESRYRFGILDGATLPEVTVSGAATLGGNLVPYVFDAARITSADSFTILNAAKVAGQFANVANGGRVDAIAFFDNMVAGTFRVTITKKSVVLSDFQPAP